MKASYALKFGGICFGCSDPYESTVLLWGYLQKQRCLSLKEKCVQGLIWAIDRTQPIPFKFTKRFFFVQAKSCLSYMANECDQKIR